MQISRRLHESGCDRGARARRRRGILEHPEELGQAQREVPCAIWQFHECAEAAMMSGYLRGALFQCRWTDYQKPTGLLTDVPGMDAEMFLGWPQFKQGVAYQY